MQEVVDEFDERASEVEQFLKVLERLEDPRVVLFDIQTRRQKRVFKEGSLKVMKATVFLMIYNLVESSIRSAFDHLYNEIAVESISGTQLRTELRETWIKQQFRGVDSDSASARTFRQLTEQLIEVVASGQTIKLKGKHLPVSGNLDADQIRQVCARHGVTIVVHKNAAGGCELRTIKDQRNALAHGSSSFSECGSQYAVSDLRRINRQAVVFVRCVLRGIRKYMDEKQYVK